ncbi:MAG: hypothetical protein ABL953_03445 [Ilumatobacteraceae bacterium]
MSDFEDPELARVLGRAGGEFPNVNVAYERLQVRVRRARRRRATVVGSATCGLLLATAFLVANRSSNSPDVQPSDRETFNGSVPDDTVNGSVPDDTVADSAPDTTVGNTSDNTTNDSNGSGNPASSTPTTLASPVTRVFAGEGGTITVRLQGNNLTLVSYAAASGFSVEVQHSSGDRVEVRFESTSHETRIRIDLENGAMDPSVEEQDN